MWSCHLLRSQSKLACRGVVNYASNSNNTILISILNVLERTYLIIDLYPKAETVALKLVFKVQRLNNLQGAGAIVVPDHGELVCSIPTVFYHLVIQNMICRRTKNSYIVFSVQKVSIYRPNNYYILVHFKWLKLLLFNNQYHLTIEDSENTTKKVTMNRILC